jgi:hypothetical protein
MKYTLKKTETGKKDAKYLYEVIDEAGNIISSRRSNREYVACTVYGDYYFGRLDLIGQGDHGRGLKTWKAQTPDEYITAETIETRLFALTNIAYL